MEKNSTLRSLVPKTEVDFLSAIDRGMHVGVQRALAEHKRMGRSIVIWRDGAIVEIPPEDIVVEEDLTNPPAPQAR